MILIVYFLLLLWTFWLQRVRVRGFRWRRSTRWYGRWKSTTTKNRRKLRLSGKNKFEKDPGIPNNWPAKEQELKAHEAWRTKAIEELEQNKVERKERVIVLSLFNSHFMNYFYCWLIMFIMICYVTWSAKWMNK